MRIAIVGGLDRNEAAYRDIARAAGHDLSFHTGRMTRRGAERLGDQVRGAALVVIVTDVNSHGAVQMARRLVRQHGATELLVRRCSVTRFSRLVIELADRAPTFVRAGEVTRGAAASRLPAWSPDRDRRHR